MKSVSLIIIAAVDDMKDYQCVRYILSYNTAQLYSAVVFCHPEFSFEEYYIYFTHKPCYSRSFSTHCIYRQVFFVI